MPNFNENNIGFTKFCQENLKSHENMLQKYLCLMAFCTGPLEAKSCFRYMSYEEYQGKHPTHLKMSGHGM